jgi:hypothetical protein
MCTHIGLIKKFQLLKEREEFSRNKDIELRKLESEERIALAKIEADARVAISQAEAQKKQSEAQALQSSLTMRMIEMLQRAEKGNVISEALP